MPALPLFFQFRGIQARSAFQMRTLVDVSAQAADSNTRSRQGMAASRIRVGLLELCGEFEGDRGIPETGTMVVTGILVVLECQLLSYHPRFYIKSTSSMRIKTTVRVNVNRPQFLEKIATPSEWARRVFDILIGDRSELPRVSCRLPGTGNGESAHWWPQLHLLLFQHITASYVGGLAGAGDGG